MQSANSEPRVALYARAVSPRRQEPRPAGEVVPLSPTPILQWISAVGLALQAEDVARGATTVDRATALIIADTAAEAGLALISSFVTDPLPHTDYGTYLARARKRGRLPEHVVLELQAVHRLRNGALHQGAQVAADDAHRATLIARHLLDVYVPRVLRTSRSLGWGSGIADAVAALLVAHDPLCFRLQQAASSLRRHDDVAALQHVAATLHLARIYAHPALPSPPILDVEGVVHFDVRPTGEGWRRSVEAWLVPIALGLTPASYSRLVADLPALTFIPGSGERGGRFAFRPFTASPGAARRSLETVSLLVLRLWISDSLRYPRPGVNADEFEDDENEET